MSTKNDQSGGLILITRPEQEAAETAEKLHQYGFSTLIDPMLSIHFTDFDVPDLSAYQALLFTSAPALRSFSLRSDNRSIPLYVVGEATAETAKTLGYEDVHSAAGNAQDLVALVQGEALDMSGALLHVRGRDVAREIDADLNEAGYKAERLVVYEATAAKKLSEKTLEALKQGDVKTVVFYSRRTAEAFLRLIDEAGLSAHLRSIKALCISESVLKCVRSYNWLSAYGAQRPNGAEMLDLIEKHGRG